MFNRQEEKKCSYFAHYFFFYTIPILYLFFTSCFGVREELIPERNQNISNLSQEVKEMYAIINHSLNDHQKEKLQEKVNSIKTPAALAEFINKTYKCYKIHKEQVKLHPQSERGALQEKFNNNICCLKQIENIINESLNIFKAINNTSTQTRQHYTDLLEILPEHKAIALKNKIISINNPEQLDQLIRSFLHNSFKQLDENTKKTIDQLPDKKRQDILKKFTIKDDLNNIDTPELTDGAYAVSQPNKQCPSVLQKENDSFLKDEGSPVTAFHLDIHELIKEKVKEQQEEVEAIPQDGWGDKLSLEGQERKEFLVHVMEFSISDQKKLKDLFNETDKDSIINFFEVYFNDKIFNKNERVELLSTMIYLYKAFPELTIRLCNEPDKVTCLQKLQLFRKTNSTQLSLLNKLQEGLENL